VYGISVAAELSGVGEQSLRLYEQRGLLTPVRTFMVKGPDALVHGRVELPFAVETGIYDES